MILFYSYFVAANKNFCYTLKYDTFLFTYFSTAFFNDFLQIAKIGFYSYIKIVNIQYFFADTDSLYINYWCSNY